MKHRFDKMNWVQGGLAVLITVILLFLVLASPSRAEVEAPPTMQGRSTTSQSHDTNDSRHAYPTH